MLRAREGQTYERGEGVSHFGGQTSVYPQDTSPSQCRTLQTVHLTDWPRQAITRQAITGQRWRWSAIGCLSWLTREKEKHGRCNLTFIHSFTPPTLLQVIYCNILYLFLRKRAHCIYMFFMLLQGLW